MYHLVRDIVIWFNSKKNIYLRRINKVIKHACVEKTFIRHLHIIYYIEFDRIICDKYNNYNININKFNYNFMNIEQINADKYEVISINFMYMEKDNIHKDKLYKLHSKYLKLFCLPDIYIDYSKLNFNDLYLFDNNITNIDNLNFQSLNLIICNNITNIDKFNGHTLFLSYCCSITNIDKFKGHTLKLESCSSIKEINEFNGHTLHLEFMHNITSVSHLGGHTLILHSHSINDFLKYKGKCKLYEYFKK